MKERSIRPWRGRGPLVKALWKGALRRFESEASEAASEWRQSSTARVGFMNCPNNLLSVIFNGAQIESDLSTMPHCGGPAGPAEAECEP